MWKSNRSEKLFELRNPSQRTSSLYSFCHCYTFTAWWCLLSELYYLTTSKRWQPGIIGKELLNLITVQHTSKISRVAAAVLKKPCKSAIFYFLIVTEYSTWTKIKQFIIPWNLHLVALMQMWTQRCVCWCTVTSLLLKTVFQPSQPETALNPAL